jgi:hypothetical protein
VNITAGETLDPDWVAANFAAATDMQGWAEPATVRYSLDRAFGQ